MDHQIRAWRLGIAVILSAVLVRLWDMGVPQRITEFLTQPNTAAFLIYLETGQDVRFSASSEVFSPDFMESPPPAPPEPTEAPLPSFSDPEAVELYYAVKKEPDIETLLTTPLQWQLQSESPTVLILHTHTTESYTRNGEPYKESSGWRTLDEEYNMLSIGALVADALAQKGIIAIQDRELHDYPSYNGSYTHARKAIQSYLEEYPTIQLVLDLHRDASGDENGQMRTRAAVNGVPSAQLMIVLGTNHEGYEENLSVALKLHAQLESRHSGIMRPLQLRAQRFNQDLSPGALLVEVGAAGNSHPEARLAAQALAEAIAALAGGTA